MTKEEQLAKNKKDNTDIAGGAGVVGGGVLAKKMHDRGHLTGRETLYHNTHKDNVKHILNKGLDSARASDKDNITHKFLSDVDEKNIANKVYFGRKKMVAKSVGQNYINGAVADDVIANIKSDKPENQLKAGFKSVIKHSNERKTLKASVPTWKMNEVDNPELRGAKNHTEFKGKLKEVNPAFGMLPEQLQDIQAKAAYKGLGRKGTAVLEGSVGSEVFKKSKNYKKLGIKEMAEFVKKNPKRFTKGVGGAALGLTAAGVGAKAIYDNHKKEAQSNERSIEKIASHKEDIYNRALSK